MKCTLTFICVVSTSIAMKFDTIAPLASSGGTLGSSGGSSTHSNTELQLKVTSPGTTVTLPQMIGLSAFEVENLMNRAGTGLSSHSKGATIPSYASVQTSNNKQDPSKTVNDINEIINGAQISPQSARIIAQSSNEEINNIQTFSSIDINNPLLPLRTANTFISREASVVPEKPSFYGGLLLNTEERDDGLEKTTNTEPQMDGLQMHGPGLKEPDNPSVAANIPHATSSSVNTVVIEQIMGSPNPEKIMTTETTTQTTPKKTNDKDNEDESGKNCISCSFKCVMNCLK